jgi:hypothetical protein
VPKWGGSARNRVVWRRLCKQLRPEQGGLGGGHIHPLFSGPPAQGLRARGIRKSPYPRTRGMPARTRQVMRLKSFSDKQS